MVLLVMRPAKDYGKATVPTRRLLCHRRHSPQCLQLLGGAHPSPGAAVSKARGVPVKIQRVEQAELATPGDGRAPLNSYQRLVEAVQQCRSTVASGESLPLLAVSM